MSEIKWIKLSIDIFNDEKFDAISTLPDGNSIQLVWIKLLCLAGKCNEGGLLMVTSELPYTDEMLAKRFGMEIGVIQRALALFQQLEMLTVVENVYLVSNWSKYQSNQSLEDIKEKNRERQKRFREKKKQELIEEKDRNVTNNVIVTESCSISYSNSFSFKNHSNLHNFENLIHNNIYKDSQYILNRRDLYQSIQDWMRYKDECKPASKNKYVSEMSMSKVLSQIVNHAMEYGTEAVIGAIDLSISNQWVGIYWDKVEKGGKKRFSQKKSEDDWQ